MGILGETKGPLEALKDFWGERPHQRRTFGSVKRTKAMTLLWALQHDAEVLAKGLKNDDVKVPGYAQLSEVMSHGWASEGGHDTRGVIQSVQAASSVRLNPLVQEDREPDA